MVYSYELPVLILINLIIFFVISRKMFSGFNDFINCIFTMGNHEIDFIKDQKMKKIRWKGIKFILICVAILLIELVLMSIFEISF